MIMNGKNYSEEIKKFFIQNSKSIDERFFVINHFLPLDLL